MTCNTCVHVVCRDWRFGDSWNSTEEPTCRAMHAPAIWPSSKILGDIGGECEVLFHCGCTSLVAFASGWHEGATPNIAEEDASEPACWPFNSVSRAPHPVRESSTAKAGDSSPGAMVLFTDGELVKIPRAPQFLETGEPQTLHWRSASDP